MDCSPHKLDWSLVRVFVAVADAGSLSGAARNLAMSQPTVGRHIHALESDLGVTLFSRQPAGMEPTPAAQKLLPAARDMLEAAGRFTLSAAGEEGDLAGTVRITASNIVSHYVLPPILAELRRREPLIEIELVPSDSTENLLFREADIALRMYRPRQLDMITRHIGDVEMGTFASRDYLDRRGRPQRIEDLAQHDLIGFDRSDLMLKAMSQMGIAMRREDFPMRIDNQTVYWELVRAGCGVGFGQKKIARADPRLEAVLPDFVIPPLPIWLTTHEVLRHTPRISRVWQHLDESLTTYLAQVS
ncbi:LysR family transcriptional regulator [Celeribacter arenosi]|uniref:LysR family transcriptional regulator n=1 Tax=Celeribacter arenosi TaxID=792649 RepID=A0ABP7K044_9RHOB